MIGLAVTTALFAVAYRIFQGDGGSFGIKKGSIELSVLPARTKLIADSSKFLSDKKGTTDTVEISTAKAALVFSPPSNIRRSPNGEIICSVTSKGAIRLYDETNGWYTTDACGLMGVIRKDQISFDPNSIK
jgi:hypothetical protein